MPKQLTPQEKKRLSYEKDHITQAEYPKAFRKIWPRLKVKSKRSERHKVRQVLSDAANTDLEDQRGDLALKPVRRKQVQNYWKRATLREDLQNRLMWRAHHTLRIQFAQPNTSDAHSSFAALLSKITEMHEHVTSRIYADVLQGLFITARPLPRYFGVFERQWLETFFRDYPEWEPRLRAWIDETL